MESAFIIFFLIFSGSVAYSQADNLEMYYPENSLFKKLHVKSILDTIASPVFHHYKREYDSLGRQISWFYVEDSVRTKFRYVKSGDTLIKYHFYTKGLTDYDVCKYELFIYDKNGKILTYKSCNKNYIDNTCECRMDNFFYDRKNRLTTKLSYLNNKYKQPFSENLKPVENLLGIIDGYLYQYDRKGNLMLTKQLGGKPDYREIDSFYYDKTNRLIKTVSRQKQGYWGELAVSNSCRIETIKYEKNKQTKTKWATCSEWTMERIKTMELEINEYLYYPNGLQKIWFQKTYDYTKSMLDYSVYEFY